MVASEQEVNAGSVDSEEHFDRTDQDLISYMLSSVLSLPQDEEDKKVKCVPVFTPMLQHQKSKSKSIYSCHNQLVCLMAGTHGGSWDAEKPNECRSETPSLAQSP